MIGSVLSLHAMLPLTLRLEQRPDIQIEFVVDTGYTGFLTLPVEAVAALQLPYLEKIDAHLADDSEVQILVYGAIILWNEEEREVRVLAMGKRPLLGTGLLSGTEFVAQFAENGLVTVEAL